MLIWVVLLLTLPLSAAFLGLKPIHAGSFAGKPLFVNPSVGIDRSKIVSQIQSEIQDIDASLAVIGNNVDQSNELTERRREAKAILGMCCIVFYCIENNLIHPVHGDLIYLILATTIIIMVFRLYQGSRRD